MADLVIKGISTFSNHGTSQGIIPRFYLQMIDIAQFAFNSNLLRERLDNFLYSNMSDFTSFYDVITEIRSIYIDYKEGLSNGKYYSIDEKSSFTQNRNNELILKKKVKDFFILGRLVIYNFGKSGVINDDDFILNNFLIVSKSNFEKNKLSCLNNLSCSKYSSLIEIIEQARNNFLTAFNQIRADFEHQNLQISDFKVLSVDNKLEIIEPHFANGNLLTVVETFYEQILDLVEILMVRFLGLKVHEKLGVMALYKRDEYNFSNLRYKYVVAFDMEHGLTKLTD